MRSFSERLRLALLDARRDGSRGLGSSSARRSDGYEFAELRAYVEGDDPRRIDWAATARAGALQSRVMLEERALSLAVAFDTSGSMYVGRTRSNHDLARDAASVWYGAAQDDDRCARVARRALVLRHARGRTGARVCELERDEPGGAFDLTLRLALATLPRGTRLLLASDFLDVERVAPLVRACVVRFDVTALVLRDPWYAGFALDGFVRLRDAETGATARAFVDRRARERYREAVAGRESATVAELRHAGARIAFADEETTPQQAFALAFGFGVREGRP